jgi:hypothetical protein
VVIQKYTGTWITTRGLDTEKPDKHKKELLSRGCSSGHKRHMQCAQGEQSGGMCTWRRRWARQRKGSYEQEAAVVEEDEEMEREDEREVAKRPDLNALDVPGWQNWH